MTTKHFNQLTEDESERLSLLAEECAEVIQAVAKIQRHGYESHNPLIQRDQPTNRELLAKEIGHVSHAFGRMVEAGDVTRDAVNISEKEKSRTIHSWLHHQGVPR